MSIIKDDVFFRFKKILAHVVEFPSPFYREKYLDAHFDIETVQAIEDAVRIPFLTRSELAKCPLWDRAYMPRDDILMCGYTSGTTSGELLPLFRNFYIGEAPDIQASKILIISLQPWRAVMQAEWFHRNGTFLVCSDLQNPPVAARVAAQVGIDAMYCTPTIAQLFAAHLQKTYDLSQIKTLLLHGERISISLRKILHLLYPNAEIRTHYASSEMGSIGISCPASEEELFHCDPNFFYEIIDESEKSVFDTPGELVLTTLELSGTPFIRYKTGDAAELLTKPCPCNKKLPVFRLAGRIGYDTIKTGGLELKVPAFERGIVGLEDKIDAGGFEIHVYEEESSIGVRPMLIFHIPTSKEMNEGEKNKIIDHIKNHTIIAPKLSIADVEVRELLAPSKFEFFAASERKLMPKKRAMLVNHL